MFRKYLHRVYQTLIRGRKRRAPKIKRTRRPVATRLVIDGLEDRTLLSYLVLSGGALTYGQSGNVSSTLTMSHDSTTHRYVFNDTTETIAAQGNFINLSGNGTHTVSFGDGNINNMYVNMRYQPCTVNIEDTLAPMLVELFNNYDVVNVSPVAHNLNNIQGAIQVYAYGQDLGNGALNVYDQSNAAAQTFSLEGGVPGLSRSGAAQILYGGFQSFTINAGNGNNTYNVSNALDFTTTTLNTGNGHDTVNVGACGGAGTFVINEGTGGVNVDLANSSHVLSDLRGAIRVNGSPAGVDNLVVDDSADPYGSAQTYTLGAGSIRWASITGSIGYNGLVNNLTIYGAATAGSTFNVQATTVPTNIVGNASTTVNLGDNGSLQGITHNVTITDPPAHATLNVNDANGVGGGTATLQTVTINGVSYGQITGLSFGAIAYRYFDTSSVNVSTPGGATVNALATGVPVNLIGGSFNTTVNVGNAGSVQAINGPLTISDPPSLATINVDDSADGTARTVSLDTVTSGSAGYGRITGLAPALIQYKYADTSSVTVQTGTGGATVNAWATWVPVSLIGHSLNSTVNVGNAGSVQQILGPLTISNPPSYTTVNVDDSADTTVRTVTLDTVTIGGAPYGRLTGLTPAAIQYKYVDTNTVTVETGPGGATVNALATYKPVNLIGNPSGPISLSASDGANTWNITGQNAGTLSSALLFGPVTFSGATNLHGGNGADTFVFADGAGVGGVIDGGGGTNTLNYSAYSSSVLVDLQTGSATGVGAGIVNIQNVTGGSGGGAGVYNILVGNGGNVLTGGDGRRNLLIAGASASTLLGGNDDDILIGGTTAYDQEADLHSLIAIMNYWSTTADDYATRVATLLSGSSNVPLLDPSMVTSNGGGNTMLGNHGGAAEMNLFYGLDPSSETTDYNPAIGERFINC
jgi:hypothetical protein